MPHMAVLIENGWRRKPDSISSDDVQYTIEGLEMPIMKAKMM